MVDLSFLPAFQHAHAALVCQVPTDILESTPSEKSSGWGAEAEYPRIGRAVRGVPAPGASWADQRREMRVWANGRLVQQASVRLEDS